MVLLIISSVIKLILSSNNSMYNVDIIIVINNMSDLISIRYWLLCIITYVLCM